MISGFISSQNCAFVFIAIRVWGTVHDQCFQVRHLNEEYRVLHFWVCAYSQTFDKNKFPHWDSYLLILFCKQSKALKWLSVLTDIPCYRRCMTAARYLHHKCAASHLLPCVPWVVGQPSQATGGGTAFPSHRWWDSLPRPWVVGQPSQVMGGGTAFPSPSRLGLCTKQFHDHCIGLFPREQKFCPAWRGTWLS